MGHTNSTKVKSSFFCLQVAPADCMCPQCGTAVSQTGTRPLLDGLYRPGHQQCIPASSGESSNRSCDASAQAACMALFRLIVQRFCSTLHSWGPFAQQGGQIAVCCHLLTSKHLGCQCHSLLQGCRGCLSQDLSLNLLVF